MKPRFLQSDLRSPSARDSSAYLKPTSLLVWSQHMTPRLLFTHSNRPLPMNNTSALTRAWQPKKSSHTEIRLPSVRPDSVLFPIIRYYLSFALRYTDRFVGIGIVVACVPGRSANSSQNRRLCSFCSHKQRCSTVLPELWYKVVYKHNTYFELFKKKSWYVSGLAVCIFVAWWPCFFGCVLQG